jgi:ATP-dependent helicase/nuclease subunit A
MNKDFTFEQCCALDCHRNMVVTAGPGAGKTRVLTERFCHILLTDDEVDIGEIVAITFTEKAAEEMKARIYVELPRMVNDLRRKKGINSATVRRLKGQLDGFSRNRIGTIHSFCAYLLRQYPVEAGIDPGFFIIQGLTQREMILAAIQRAISSLARENGDDLTELIRIFGNRRGLLQGIHQVIEHPVTLRRVLETRDHLFKKEDWKEQVFAEYCAYIRDECLIPYYHGLRDMRNRKGQFEQVLDLLDEWYRGHDSHPLDSGVPSLFAELRRLSRERPPGSARLAVRWGTSEISYLDLIEAYHPDLFAIFNPDDIYERGLDIFLQLTKLSFENYRQDKGRVNALDFADLEARTIEFLTNLYLSRHQSLIRRIQERFKYIMVDEFQDTNRSQWEIIRFLVTERGAGENPVLRGHKLFVVGDKRQAIYRFRGADVTVFEAVTDEIKRSNAGSTRPFFWHDDRAVRRICERDEGLGPRLSEHVSACAGMPADALDKLRKGDIHLGLNFRSDPALISFFNNTFPHVFSNKGSPEVREYECEYLPMTMPGPSPEGRECGSVVFYLIPVMKGRSPGTEGHTRAEREASLIADIIQRIMGRSGEDVPEYRLYRSIGEMIDRGEPAIGILFFAYTHIKTFEAVFREAHLPFIVHKGRGFYRSEEVMEMVQLLQYLVNEEERISLLAALRGSIFALTDPEVFDFFTDNRPFHERFLESPNEYIRTIGHQLCRWRELASHVTIPELIRTIMGDRGRLAVLSCHPNRTQRMANIEKLIEIGRQFEAEGNGALPDFVSYCLRMADEADDEGEALVEVPQGAPLHLMTIHSAKGLEFPMVIIPELDRSLPMDPKAGTPMRLYPARRPKKGPWNDREGILPVFGVEYPLADFRRVLSPLAFLLKTRNVLEEVAENRRVFYVGCTRAIHHLIFTGHMSIKEGTRVGHSLSPYDYRQGAPILELMDDVWDIRSLYRDDAVGAYPRDKGLPRFVWEDPEPRQFASTQYPHTKITGADFGKMNEEIERLDFTAPLAIPPHHQLSPTGLALYKRCPLRFYYRYFLNIPEDPSCIIGYGLSDHVWEDKVETDTIEPRIIGTIVHAYLERHHFGSNLDHDLLHALLSSILGQTREAMLLERSILERMRTRVQEMVRAAITDDELVGLLAGVTQHTELAFTFNSARYTLRGRIDKLFMERSGDGWAILDWKTGDVQGMDPIRFARKRFFDVQLACYRLAVETLKNTRVTRMYLYFTSLGRLVEIDYHGDVGKEIDELVDFIEEYRSSPEEVGGRVRGVKKGEAECTTCGYEKLGVC